MMSWWFAIAAAGITSPVWAPALLDAIAGTSLVVTKMNRVQVRSTVDARNYHVLDLPDRQQAADTLARLRKQLWGVVSEAKSLRDKGQLQPELSAAVALLGQRVRSIDDITLIELDGSFRDGIAYNIRKGKGGIHLCIRDYSHEDGEPTRPLASGTTALFVALHELSHSMTDAYAHFEHSPLFKRCEKFMMDVAQRLGYLQPSLIPGSRYCGAVIPAPATAR